MLHNIDIPEITSYVPADKPKFDWSTLLSGIPGLVGTLYNIYTNKRDFDYQKALQAHMEEREDTAVQRRKADLEAAGFNPALAMGQAASAGPVVARSSTNDVNMGAALDTAAAMSQLKAQQVQTQNLREEQNILHYKAKEAYNDWIIRGYEQQQDEDFYNFLYSDTWQKSDQQMKEYHPRLYEYFNNMLRDQKNTTELLEKQNNWYNANQVIDALTGGVGAVTGAVNAGASMKRASSLYKRYH